MLVNKLRYLLPTIISKNQSTYMPRRLITDTIIVAYEALHSIKIRKKGQNDSMVIKLDISKTYNKLEWSFFEKIDWKGWF